LPEIFPAYRLQFNDTRPNLNLVKTYNDGIGQGIGCNCEEANQPREEKRCTRQCTAHPMAEDIGALGHFFLLFHVICPPKRKSPRLQLVCYQLVWLYLYSLDR